jgi:amino acid transporter
LAAQKGTFIREATGLVRDVRAVDAWVFGVMAISLGTGIATTYTLGPALFPGGSIPIAVGLFVILALFKDATYAQMGTAMPRSGSEYVFQARSLSSFAPWAVGNQISYNIMWQGTIYQALNGIMFASIALAPLMIMLGTVTGNNAMISFASWIGTPLGTYVIIVLLSAASISIVALGIKFYMQKFQRILFGVGMAQVIAIVAILATTSNGTFISKFNSFSASYFGNSDAYHLVINEVSSMGISTSFSWLDTLGLMAFVSFGLIWGHGIIANMGELKHGNSLKTYTWVFMGATIFTGFFAILIGGLLVHTMGSNFLTSIGYLAFNDPSKYPLPVSAFYTFLVSTLTNNIPLLILINGGMIAWALQWSTNNSLGYSRLALALAFDRILPAKFGDVDSRFHTPYLSLIFFFLVGAVGFGALVAFVGIASALIAATIAQIFNFATTGVAAMVFPYTKKSMYEQSPGARWKIGGLPVIVITGAVTLAVQVMFLAAFFAIPGVGLSLTPSSIVPISVVLGILAGGIIYYFIMEHYQRSKGVDIKSLFNEIPPE